jgi:hypothetical protein
VKVAVWIAAALALGWLLTAGAAVALPGGHPPSWYVVGAAVVLLSFVLAPIGVGVGMAAVRRARQQASSVPQRAVVAIGLNALFLIVAVSLWFLFQWAATRR